MWNIWPKTDLVPGEWRILHNEGLHDLYCSSHIVWVMKLTRILWAGHVARMAERRAVYGVLVGLPEGNRSLVKHRHRWE